MRALCVLFIALVLALAGCGGDEEPAGSGGDSAATAESTPADAYGGGGGGGGGGDDGGGGGGDTLSLSAPEDGSLAFEPEALSAAAGTVTIEFENPASTPHGVAIEGNGVEEKSDTVTGGSTSVSAELEAGEYTFYCPVGSHRTAGMEGTLTVE
jgi:plastocyanin